MNSFFPSFSEFFQALWKPYDPFPWQTMLAEQISVGNWPKALDLPTAAGKTACIDAAIYALASQSGRHLKDRTAPRRIWFVVDRRIVVDEAFDRASIIAHKLSEAQTGPLKAIADRLRTISGTERPLAVARLRGGILQDQDGWARLPSQPAIITSTVDQLGSRLLFRGYGRSTLVAPIFAGLAAHDSLILLDEAHCSVPFLQTLCSIETYRGSAWAETPITTPFAFTILSATPPPDIPKDTVFPGCDRERALDHPVLHKRLSASKPAELVVIKTRANEDDPLVIKAAAQAQSYLDKHNKHRVAVIVNRVRTAEEIAYTLREQTGGKAEIVLLTGRIRPYERDCLIERWKPLLKASSRIEPEKPIILVSTQCIEVGADFSFDALVTEAASLDALRQRFGRLNRMGMPGPAPATIIIRDRDTKEEQVDPIYGNAIPQCWKLLSAKASCHVEGKNERKTIDFGFVSLDDSLSNEEDLSRYLAPRPNAPVLLPAHLDLLCQTAPTSNPEPDVQLFLHGMDKDTPEVRVVWRADLSVADTTTWEEAIALCPPNSGEMLSVSLHRLRAWLLNKNSVDEETTDVEGTTASSERSGENAENAIDNVRVVFVWQGRDRSKLCTPSAIKPNDIVVIPAEYGISGIGQSEPVKSMGAGALDLWEFSRVAAGRPQAMRLHRAVLEPWLKCPPLKDLVLRAEDPERNRESLQEGINAVLEYHPTNEDEPPAPPTWLLELFRLTYNGRIEDHPAGGVVLFVNDPTPGRTEPDLFADDDDLLSSSGQEVTLALHSASVERAVGKIASRCLPDEFSDPLRRAAYWHDVGKLDERFQLLLRQGNELAVASGEPLAKSAFIPTSPARRRAIREASNLPQDFRHEMLSLQLAERYAALPNSKQNADLVLHLIASHHGYARPFAPICLDSEPPAISSQHDGVIIEISTPDRTQIVGAHRINSGLSERFWQLTRRYGWWGLAYLEAVLRLADWHGSQWVLDDDHMRISTSPAPQEAAVIADTSTTTNGLVLTGIDGANPLGFLAALGVLTVLNQNSYPEARLSWKRTATWQPILTGVPLENNTLCDFIATALRGICISDDAEEKRRIAQKNFDAAKKAVDDKNGEIKKRHLRGKERDDVVRAEIEPLEQEACEKRGVWLDALKMAVPRPELAIGKRIDCSPDEYREYATNFLQGGSIRDREALDFLAAFASDACCSESSENVSATPFCFITGSGQQYFLDTVRQLMTKVTSERIQSTLFEPWIYTDEKLSLRWDPMEARRYALMDRNPTASDNKSRTVWMANILAYRALTFFPSVPSRKGLRTTGWSWSRINKEKFFTWPIWEHPADLDTIRSMMLLPDLSTNDCSALRTRGIVAAFRARRIQVGDGANVKTNFSPAQGV